MFKNQITLKKITFSKEKKGLDLLSYIRRICTYFYHQQVVIVRWCWKSVVNHVQTYTNMMDSCMSRACTVLWRKQERHKKRLGFLQCHLLVLLVQYLSFSRQCQLIELMWEIGFFFTLYIYCWMKNVLKCCINSLLETILFPRQFKNWTLNSHFTWI